MNELPSGSKDSNTVLLWSRGHGGCVVSEGTKSITEVRCISWRTEM